MSRSTGVRRAQYGYDGHVGIWDSRSRPAERSDSLDAGATATGRWGRADQRPHELLAPRRQYWLGTDCSYTCGGEYAALLQEAPHRRSIAWWHTSQNHGAARRTLPPSRALCGECHHGGI